MNKLYLLIVLSCLFMINGNIFASEVEQEKEDKFDVNKLIMAHIKDAHDWHILDYTDKAGNKVPVSIPLPIILIHNGQFDIFMSSKFEHGHKTVTKGNNTYLLDDNTIYLADANGELSYEEKEGAHIVLNEKPLDFSITKNIFSMMIVSVLLLLVFLSMAKAYKRNLGRPKGLQALLEPVIMFVKDEIAFPNLGNKTNKFLPFLLTIFFFILFNNLMGIIPIFPGGANVTGNIAVTMTLALFTFFAINLSGNKNYWKHTLWMPGVPVFIKPILAVVEIMGMIVKPVALTIRLFANITAGHIIILSLVSLIFIYESLVMSPVSVLFVLFMNCLELLVAFLQAYIFTMLSALFIGMAVEEAH
ncbi:MAG: F0F1 ATP synthase subunit A [Bacteroidales bacterium]|nr:F0F1 ATP synthase subunit A [Bacteroidales bacterium]MDD4215731.1 F0F1 ATP synthase subunit A [Bacteroidales bacterium]MDY0140338.1 F0F1 ATP synthase subunit A [Bacteroidales bacterium]